MTFVYRLVIALFVLCAAASTISRGQEDAGRGAYDRICQVCHGPEGRGDAGPSLVPLEKEYGEVLGIVREGLGQMPPISAERVGDEEVKRIVEYLKSLKHAP